MGILVLLLFIVNGLTIDLDETVELHHFALGHKLIINCRDIDVDGCLLNLGISHLTGDSALPD